ncbi:MAG: hypothetical protein IKA07_03000 [Alistipes sp.]|nr:hypothetical protein [Alistipes sp.]
MKHLAKLTLVVLAFCAYSCTTDATEDLGIALGGSETTINLSLEQSRTELGTEANGIYPLYWSEGDKISVNGVESTEAAIDASNAANAAFNVVATAPYCIAYPAAPAGKVLFAEVQTHVGNGSFSSGVSTMYGYGESTLSVGLKHLTGVLKIGVKGSAVLKKAQISTIDRAPIAGPFDIDFQSGEVTATAESKQVIEYSFGEGAQLSDKATYLHVAVPAGEYDELYVTLYDAEGGIMYATVKADKQKPLVAGNVRNFAGAIEYVANADVFVISDATSLQKFAADVTAAAGLFAKDVVLVNDVDASEIAWTSLTWNSLVGDKRCTFNGNGYAIKGLTAPLFDILTANVKGLHLEDVNITTTATYAGALANQLGGVVENCTTSGVINYSCSASGAFVGGIAGIAIDGASFYNVTNYCALNPKKNHQLLYPGGICGCIGAAASTVINNVVVFDNCHNKGNITILPGNGSTSRNTYAGGILGSYHKPLTMTNCTNSGDIEHQLVKTKNSDLGGLIGRTYTGAAITVENCSNSGNISSYATSTENTQVGGCFGYLSALGNSKLKNLSNSGNITIDATATKALQAGGIGGYITSIPASCVAGDFSNTGTITVKGTTATSASAGGCFGYLGIGAPTIDGMTNSGAVECLATTTDIADCGGIVGYLTGDAPTNANLSNFTNKGTVTLGGVVGTRAYLGGVAGYFVSKSTGYTNVSNFTNEATATVTMKADFAFADAATTDHKPTVGGVIGLNSYNHLTNVTNEAQLIWAEEGKASSAPSGSELLVGGAIGQHYFGNINTLTNKGAVIFKADNRNHHHHLGGVIGQLGSYGCTVTGLHNSGNITIDSTCGTKRCRLGGLVGVLYRSDISDCLNSGTITYNALKTANQMYIAGCIGYAYTGSGDNLNTINVKNSGSVIINEGTASNGADIRVAGIIGYMNNDTTNTTISGCVNIGNIEANIPTTFTSVVVSGLIAQLSAGPVVTDCTHHAQIKAVGFEKVSAILGSSRQEYSETTTEVKDETTGEVTTKVTKTLARIAKNCKVGGSFIGEWDEEDEEFKTESITSRNFYNYIYVGETNWGNSTDYDGCTYLATKPVIE